MKSLMCILMLLLLHGSSISAVVDIPLDNTTAQVCVGQCVRLVCNINGAFTFSWTVPGLQSGSNIVITTTEGSRTSNEFNLTAVPGSSTISFNVFIGLNNTDITCEGIASGITQSILTHHVQILDNPIVPMVQLTQDPSSPLNVNVEIIQPEESHICVREYQVSASNGSGISVEKTIPKSISSTTSGEVRVLGLCRSIYTFSVSATYLNNEVSSSVAIQQRFPFIGNVTGFTWSTGADNSLIITEPMDFNNCVKHYQYNDGNNTNATTSGDTLPLNNFDRQNCGDCMIELTPVIYLDCQPLTNSSFSVPIDEPASPSGSDEQPTPSPVVFPWWIIVVIVLVVIGTVLILLAIIICCWKWRQHQARARSKQAEASAQMMQYDHREQVVKQQQADTHDFIPTYQDVNTIQHETVGPSNDVYTVVDKQKTKGSKKKSEKKDEVPMYSMVNKDKNSTDGNPEGLVYTEVSVQSSKSSRSRPPPPPGVAQLDANEPVLYSTVETPQQRH